MGNYLEDEPIGKHVILKANGELKQIIIYLIKYNKFIYNIYELELYS